MHPEFNINRSGLRHIVMRGNRQTNIKNINAVGAWETEIVSRLREFQTDEHTPETWVTKFTVNFESALEDLVFLYFRIWNAYNNGKDEKDCQFDVSQAVLSYLNELDISHPAKKELTIQFIVELKKQW